MEDAGFLKYVDIPFAFSLITLIILPNLDTNTPSKIALVTFLFGIIASSLEIIDPVEWGLKRYTKCVFKKKNRKIRLQTVGKEEIELDEYIRASLQSKALSKPKNRITGMFYLMVISVFTIIRLIQYPLLNIQIWDLSLYGVLVSLLLLVIWFTYREIRNFPRHVDSLNVYYMMVRGIIPEVEYFNEYRSAIEQGDWATARVHFSRGIGNQFTPEPEIFPL